MIDCETGFSFQGVYYANPELKRVAADVRHQKWTRVVIRNPLLRGGATLKKVPREYTRVS